MSIWAGVSVGFFHLGVLIAILRLWERWYPETDLTIDKLPVQQSESNFLAFAILGLAAIAQLGFFVMPVLSAWDESVMIATHIDQFLLFKSNGFLWQVAFVLCCYAIWRMAIQLSIPVLADRIERKGTNRIFINPWFSIAVLFFLAILFGLLENNSPFAWGLASRWPPLGTVLAMPVLAISTDMVHADRFLSLFYYLGTCYLIYRIAEREFGHGIALLGMTLLLLAPDFFIYGHYAFREMGGVFFFTLGIYILQAFLHNGNLDHYGVCMAVATFAFMQRRPSILLAVVVALTLLIVFRQRLFHLRDLRALIMPGLAMIWVIGPWLVITKDIRPYEPAWGNLLDVSILFGYLSAMPYMAGFPILILSVVGLIAGLMYKQEKTLFAIVLIWIMLFSVLFAMDYTAPWVIRRFAIQFLPPLALLACFGYSLVGRTNFVLRASTPLLFVTSSVLVLIVWLIDDDRRYQILPSFDSQKGYSSLYFDDVVPMRFIDEWYFPFDQAAQWLENHPGQVVIYQPKPWQSALPVYIRSRNMEHVKLDWAGWHLKSKEISFESALKTCRKYDCDYLLEPVQKNGQLFFHDGETEQTLSHKEGIGEIIRFQNRHGIVLFVKVNRH